MVFTSNKGQILIGIIIVLVAASLFASGLHYYSQKQIQEISEMLPAEILPLEKKPKSLTLMFVGDLMLDRGVRHMVEKYGEGDYRFPFLKIKPFLEQADILFGNLESIISDKGTKIGNIPFRAEPQAAEGLIYAGFDVVSVANNHIFDYGREAMEDSFLRLKEAGIAYAGGGFNEQEAYSPVIKEIENTKIAFLAYTDLTAPYWTAQSERSGIALLTQERVEEDIKGARSRADLVIVSFHYGYEYQSKPNDFQISISRAAIEAGADLVVGHHPHVIQPVEKYKTGHIAYSLGNFIFDQAFSKETMKGLILKVIVEEGEIKEVIQIEAELNEYFQPEIPAAAKPNIPSPSVKLLSEDSGSINCLYSVSGIPSPKGVAFTPDGKEFWVTSLMNKARGVAVFDAETGNHKKDIVLPGGGGVEIIFNANGSRAFVSQMETGRVFEIGAETKEIIRIFDTKSSWTKVLALSPGENFIYASNWVGNDVSAIDLESGQLLRNIPTVFTPRGIYATQDNAFLYVAGFDKGEIQKINLKTGAGAVLYKSGGAMRHIAADEERGALYFSDMAKGMIFKADMETGEIKEFAKTENNPNTIVFTPDKKVLIVSNRGANHPSGQINIPGPEKGSILFFDALSGEKLAAITGGNQPTALDVSPDGRYFIYSNFLDGNLLMCEIPLDEKK